MELYPGTQARATEPVMRYFPTLALVTVLALKGYLKAGGAVVEPCKLRGGSGALITGQGGGVRQTQSDIGVKGQETEGRDLKRGYRIR